MAGVIKQKYAVVPVDELKTHPKNARRGAVGAINDSVAANGFYGAIVVQKSTGYVLVGNHRLEVAKANGIKKIPAFLADVDDDKALKILTVDNKVGDEADWDDRRLAELLGDMPDLDGSGFTDDDLDALMRETGMLGDAAAGWLDDDEIEADEEGDEGDPADRPDIRPEGNGRGPAAPEEQYVGVSWTVTVEQRDVVNAALRQAKADHGCPTFADALVEVCRAYTEGGSK